MKKLVLISGLLFAMCFNVAKAGEKEDLTAQFDALNSEFKALSAERATLKKRKDDLDWAADQLRPKIAQMKADDANLTVRISAQQQRIDVHNSRCSGTFDDRGFVESCNTEKANLDATSAPLMSERANLQRTYDLLKENVRVHTEEEAKVLSRDKAALERQQQIITMAKPIMARLKEIALQNDGCKAAVAQVDAHPENQAYKENMHAVCGAMFDGNR